jgi:glycosyltransferase involved in cell wall biosynthesis
MIQVEANACEKPVIAIDAMAFRDTMVHGETAFLAGVAKEIMISEAVLGEDQGFQPNSSVSFGKPRTSDYRASVNDIATHLLTLMRDAELRKRMGKAGRHRVVERFDYRIVASRFVEIIQNRLGIR